MYVWTSFHYWPSVQHGHNLHFKTIFFQIMRKKFQWKNQKQIWKITKCLKKTVLSNLYISVLEKWIRHERKPHKLCTFTLQVVTWCLFWHKGNQNSLHLHVYHSILILVSLWVCSIVHSKTFSKASKTAKLRYLQFIWNNPPCHLTLLNDQEIIIMTTQ